LNRLTLMGQRVEVTPWSHWLALFWLLMLCIVCQNP
jgi:hypothetical protein